VRLVPVEKLTFPDQQQDLQNAAEFSLASECDGSVKFARQAEEADSGAIRLPDRVWVGGPGSDEAPTGLRSTVGVTMCKMETWLPFRPAWDSLTLPSGRLSGHMQTTKPCSSTSTLTHA
jgi:hypothetical protein